MSSQLSFSASPSLKRRRSSYGPSQASSAGGRKRRIIGRRSLARTLAAKNPTFTETFFHGQITAGTGGLWQPQFSSVPERADYAALYRSYKILKVEIIVLPESNVAQASLGTAGIGQLIFAVDPSAELATPASVVDVLNNNKVSMCLTDTSRRMRFTPVPAVSVGIIGGGGADTAVSIRPQWLSFDGSGMNVFHNGVTWWYQNSSAGANCTANVYFKLTFQCKDPR